MMALNYFFNIPAEPGNRQNRTPAHPGEMLLRDWDLWYSLRKHKLIPPFRNGVL